MKQISKNITVFNAITLNRNLSNHPFPIALTEESSKSLFNEMLTVLSEAGLIKTLKLATFDSAHGQDFKLEMATKFAFDTGEYEQLHEGRVIKSGYLMNGERDVFVALNCGEHLRIMETSAKLSLRALWENIDTCDSLLEPHLIYAYDEQYGYLTSDVGLIGTGLKVATVLDLPCLTQLAYMEKIIEAATHLGVMVERVFEATEGGSFYRLSNRNTLGLDERGVIDKIEQVAAEVVKKELEARETLFISKRLEMEDRVMRAYGLAKYGRLLKSRELYRCLSDLKLGVYLGLIDDIEDGSINEVLLRHMDVDGRTMKPFGPKGLEVANSQMVRELIKG